MHPGRGRSSAAARRLARRDAVVADTLLRTSIAERQPSRPLASTTRAVLEIPCRIHGFLEAKEHLLAHQIDDADPHVVHALAVDLDRAVGAARGMCASGRARSAG